MKTEPLVQVRNLTRIYEGRVEQVTVFRNLDMDVARGEMVAVVGASGAGKSTLLHLIGGLDRATSGSVKIGEFDITKSGELDLASFRNRRIGFVFQFHHLLPEFSALENVMMPLLISGRSKRDAAIKAAELLQRAGLKDRIDHRPGELSGGEQQRASIARALVCGPQLLLADEPTGNLDQRTGQDVLRLIQKLQVEEHLTAIIVTHNETIASSCDRILRLEDGRLLQD
ncbi:MAG: ABC transporter ATP-binding protein [Acidobacteria bacterium]|nr:ABC transporter ATP-binding protein [Acidobacteriota bacterium]